MESASWLQMVFRWFRRRILRDRAARWNHQYATGRWEKLKSGQEQARLDATALLLTRHMAPGRVLEIGCGEALLQQRLHPARYLAWTGVDISELAIQRAQAFAGEQVRYLVADMETFDPGERFEAIIFPESAYYSADCARLVQRYTRFLTPGGVFIVSIFQTKRSAAIWADIHSVTRLVDSTTTTNRLGTWDCEVLRPRVPSMT